MGFSQDLKDMFSMSSFCQEPCSCILHQLQTGNCCITEASKKWVEGDKARGNEGVFGKDTFEWQYIWMMWFLNTLISHWMFQVSCQWSKMGDGTVRNMIKTNYQSFSFISIQLRDVRGVYSLMAARQQSRESRLLWFLGIKRHTTGNHRRNDGRMYWSG